LFHANTWKWLRPPTGSWNPPSKLLCVARLALLDDVDEVVREDEGHTFPLDAELGLEVAQDVAKVNVEELGVRR
jgi:hypothetical protein